MLKKRLIFTLLVRKGVFQLSRNFSLQTVGNFDWLSNHYKLTSITRSIDELVLLNVARDNEQSASFLESVAQLGTLCFMPIAAGGGIRTIDDAYRVLDAGADKLVVNTALFSAPMSVEGIARNFGSQCVVASLDYKRTASGLEVWCENGKKNTGMGLEDAVRRAESVGAGELYVTSIDRDGTGQGYDLEALEFVTRSSRLPVIASGGVGDFRHFLEGLSLDGVTGASTANIFNFMSDGLTQARTFIEAGGLRLAHWEFSDLPAQRMEPQGAQAGQGREAT
jgi:imidazole glycerol-phosphate synthase subunit HisF